MVLNRNSVITAQGVGEPVRRALANLQRDLEKVCRATEEQGAEIRLVTDDTRQPECFQIAAAGRLEIRAADTLGFVYGVYAVSRTILGVTDFWFWNDQKFIPREEIPVPDGYQYQSRPCHVRFRGWFVNDEVLIHQWSVDGKKEKPWEMVFEALLRCGGNLVIPGTDANSKLYRKLASDMGLYITHHHAEPLGAEMFARAYPRLTPSYAEHADKFQQLWRDAVEDQKGLNVIWTLGFRGQGDCPFWENDPQYRTAQSRGELISRLIRIQYDLVKQANPDAVCCTNLYGETMELYRDGYLKLPEDVIKIWADNGFGKMVTRRQGNHNPRVPALPDADDRGRHGIYYHVSFYDLQAANHITMLPNTPEFVRKELGGVLALGVKDYWIVNCSNVKPHVYFLDLVATVWRDGDVDIEQHRAAYAARYYGKENVGPVSESLAAYPKYALAYGRHEDEHAGEQFSNHVARMLISQYMKDNTRRAEDLLWATDAASLKEQVLWYRALCGKARDGYREYLKLCGKTAAAVSDEARRLFEDSIYLQARIHFHCFTGAYWVCESLLQALEDQYPRAFYDAGKAKAEYLAANTAMRGCEHGKWRGFYANECLTDVKQTAWVLSGLMSYLRNLGDGPHFYRWQREFLYSERDRRVLTLLTFENHVTDDEMYIWMDKKWGE